MYVFADARAFVLLLTFENVAARDAYLPHPDHQRVKEVFLPLIEKIVILDFEV